MFNLSIAANTAEELRLKLLDLVNQFKTVNVTKAAEPPKEIKPVISQAQMEENQKNAPEHKLPDPPSIEDVRAAMKALKDAKGASAVREILKAYGAETLSELKEEDYLGAMDRARMEA